MKYLHFARDHYYPEIDVHQAATWLLVQKGEIEAQQQLTNKELLLIYRKLDRAGVST